MKNKYLLIFLLMVVGVNILYSSDAVDAVQEFKDAAVSNFINSFIIVKEYKDTPYTLKIIKTQEDGECGKVNGKYSCPKSWLYFVVSTFDEYPDKKIFKTKSATEWELMSESRIPKKEDDTFVLTLQRVIYQDKKYVTTCIVKINLEKAELNCK